MLTIAYDADHPEAGVIPVNVGFYQSPTADAWNYYLALVGPFGNNAVDVQANAGSLSLKGTTISQSVNVHSNTGSIAIEGARVVNVYSNDGQIAYQSTRNVSLNADVFNVFGNDGAIGIDYFVAGSWNGYVNYLTHVVNVRGNMGTIDLRDVAASHLIAYFADAQVNIGDNGSLSNVQGVINFSNYNSRYGLLIDDSNGGGAAWTIDSTQTRIGDLTLNYAGVNAPAPYLDIFSKYQAFPNAGSIVTLSANPPFFTRELSGADFPAWQLSAPSYFAYKNGEEVDVALSVSGNPGGPVAYAATNLPPGLSIDTSTGLIAGIVASLSNRLEPYEATVTATAGQLTRLQTTYWYIGSAIEILPPTYGSLLGHEGMAVSWGPITTTNTFNRPVTLSASNLPPGLTLSTLTGSISGVIQFGAAQNGPYDVVIHATDGIESAAYEFTWDVSGITILEPSLQNDHVGDNVSLAIQAATASGAPLLYSAEGLPEGLTIHPTSGLISGIVGVAAASIRTQTVSVTATNGNDAATSSFQWSILPANVSNFVSIVDPGEQFGREGRFAYLELTAFSSLNLPLVFSAVGLPPGVTFFAGNDASYLGGEVHAGAAVNSPYHVTIIASDGAWSDEVSFDWIVSSPSTVEVYGSGNLSSLVNDVVEFGVYAVSSLSEPLTYSAVGLPLGLSIDTNTGIISGVVSPLAALPSAFHVSIAAASVSGSDQTSFVWNVLSSYESNVIALPHPSGIGVVEVISPIGTQLTASISSYAGVALPAGVTFPFGFVTFTISGLEPGAAADLTIVGLDPALVTDYYKYGATPTNSAEHWYNFLFGIATDGDSAIGTGMEIVGDTLVLHLIDGGRGDDDLAMNGVIFDIGGPAAVNFTPRALPGDYNLSGVVDAADYVLWRKRLGASGVTPYSGADGSGDGQVDATDYTVWQANFGRTLEPGAGSSEQGSSGSGTLATSQQLAEDENAATVGSSVESQDTSSQESVGQVDFNLLGISSGTRHEDSPRQAARSRLFETASTAEASGDLLVAALARQVKCAKGDVEVDFAQDDEDAGNVAVDEVFARIADEVRGI